MCCLKGYVSCCKLREGVHIRLVKVKMRADETSLDPLYIPVIEDMILLDDKITSLDNLCELLSLFVFIMKHLVLFIIIQDKKTAGSILLLTTLIVQHARLKLIVMIDKAWAV